MVDRGWANTRANFLQDSFLPGALPEPDLCFSRLPLVFAISIVPRPGNSPSAPPPWLARLPDLVARNCCKDNVGNWRHKHASR